MSYFHYLLDQSSSELIKLYTTNQLQPEERDKLNLGPRKLTIFNIDGA